MTAERDRSNTDLYSNKIDSHGVKTSLKDKDAGAEAVKVKLSPMIVLDELGFTFIGVFGKVAGTYLITESSVILSFRALSSVLYYSRISLRPDGSLLLNLRQRILI